MDDKVKVEMITNLKSDLSDNYRSDDESVLDILIDYYTTIASNSSNRDVTDELLYPYVYNAVKEAYLLRGYEGSSSASEGSISHSHIDVEKKLRDDVREIRVYRL